MDHGSLSKILVIGTGLVVGTASLAAAGQQGEAASGEQQFAQAAGTSGDQKTIGGGLDMPRDQIDTKYGPLAWMTFDEIIGQDVVNADGTTIGEIIGLVRDRDTKAEFFAVFDPDGPTGGEDGVAVPVGELDLGEDQKIVLSEAAEAELEQMPGFDAERYEDLRQ